MLPVAVTVPATSTTTISALALLVSRTIPQYSHFWFMSRRDGRSLIPLAVAVVVMVAERKQLRRKSVAVDCAGFVAVLISTAGWG